MRKLFVYIALLTLAACLIFVAYNPNIASNFTQDFEDGEVFTPHEGHFDFRNFSLNCSKANNFTAKVMGNGHVQFHDDTGNITINYLELDNMIQLKRDRNEDILNHELEKPSWSVDGVIVHEIDFIFYDDFYSAYQKNSNTDTIIYLSTPNDQLTADMMNSLEFTKG